MDCDIVGLQETRCSGQSAVLQAGYVVCCTDKVGGDGGRGGGGGRGGVGLAVRKIISLAEVRSSEFISDRLLKVTLELCGRARTVTFVSDMLQQKVLTEDTLKLLEKARFLDSHRQVREISARAQTAVCVF